MAKPTVALDPITIHTDSTATFSGKVEANAPATLTPAAEVAFETTWQLTCSPACPTLSPDDGGGTVTAAEGSRSFSVDATKLDPDTTYVVTLTATNIGGSSHDSTSVTTTTIAPAAEAAPGASDGKGGYTLQGVVNPHSSALSDCKFVYGPSLGADPSDYPFAVPCSPIPAEVNRPVTVEGHLTGLTPGSTYHSRLVVTNSVGTVITDDQTFEPTLDPSVPACPNEQLRAENNSLALAGCRAYEQVTPPNKTGYPASLFAFFEGKSVAFETLAADINGSGQASASPGRYVANRSDTGWETIPNLNGPSGSLFSGPEGLFGINFPALYSADLQSSLWYTRPGAISNSERDPYLRDPSGQFTKIGSAIPEAGGSLATGVLTAGSSADLSHLVFNGEAPPNPAYLGRGVFEFIGTGNDLPLRVDVDNAGDQISQCGPIASTGGSAVADAVSPDGSVIIFTAIGGCGGSNPAADEVWARVDESTSFDASRSLCTRIAGDPGGACNAPAPAHFEGASADGSSIFFTTTQQLVNGDTDETNDLYVYDLPTATNPSPTLSEVSGPGSNARVEEVARTSADGSTAYFVAAGVLAGNVDAFGEEAVAGDHNLYVWRRDVSHPGGQTKFIGRLSDDDLRVPLNGEPQIPQTTPDGRYLVLTTASSLVPTDTDTSRDVYLYDAGDGVMTRVSTDTSGVGGNADGLDASIASGAGEVQRRHSHPAVTDDGKMIVFTTREALSPLDVNGAPDVYLWDAGHVSLITTGAAGGGGSAAVIDESGQDVYFETEGQLTPSDGDDVKDVYDARIGGGFATGASPACTGEACQPAGPETSASPSPQTDGAPVVQGKAKRKPCPKGKVARKGRCVKKSAKGHHKKHHKHSHEKTKRTTDRNRRGDK